MAKATSSDVYSISPWFLSKMYILAGRMPTDFYLHGRKCLCFQNRCFFVCFRKKGNVDKREKRDMLTDYTRRLCKSYHCHLLLRNLFPPGLRRFLSRGHATLYPAVSVYPSVRLSALYAVFALLSLSNCPRRWCHVSSLVLRSCEVDIICMVVIT